MATTIVSTANAEHYKWGDPQGEAAAKTWSAEVLHPTHDDDAVMDGAPVLLWFCLSKLNNHLQGFFTSNDGIKTGVGQIQNLR